MIGFISILFYDGSKSKSIGSRNLFYGYDLYFSFALPFGMIFMLDILD